MEPQGYRSPSIRLRRASNRWREMKKPWPVRVERQVIPVVALAHRSRPIAVAGRRPGSEPAGRSPCRRRRRTCAAPRRGDRQALAEIDLGAGSSPAAAAASTSALKMSQRAGAVEDHAADVAARGLEEGVVDDGARRRRRRASPARGGERRREPPPAARDAPHPSSGRAGGAGRAGRAGRARSPSARSRPSGRSAGRPGRPGRAAVGTAGRRSVGP